LTVWSVGIGGESTPLRQFKTQAPAREFGIDVSKEIGADFLLQGLDRKFIENNTYPRSRDPRNIQG
jgi:hypothetical protein